MSIKLASNETMIREYHYATTKEGLINKRETKSSILVTDKRIIKRDVCDKNGYEKVSSDEISVDAVTGVNVKASSSFKFAYLVLGIISAILGIFMLSDSFGQEMVREYNEELGRYVTETETKIYFGEMLFALVFVALAAFLIYKFVTSRINLLVCDFTIADRRNLAMSAGSVSYNSLFSKLFVSGKSRFVKIIVDAGVSKEFVNEIGALILDIQSGAANQTSRGM